MTFGGLSVRSLATDDNGDGELRREQSMLSKLEDSVERAENRTRELEHQIEAVLGIQEAADLQPVDLRYEGKKVRMHRSRSAHVAGVANPSPSLPAHGDRRQPRTRSFCRRARSSLSQSGAIASTSGTV